MNSINRVDPVTYLFMSQTRTFISNFTCLVFLCSMIWGMGCWCVLCSYWWNYWSTLFKLTFNNNTSVDTEMGCPKGKCGCQYFILLTLKKKFMDTGVLDFFNKKVILDLYFCLKSGPVFLFHIFIIAPLPLPRDIQLYH